MRPFGSAHLDEERVAVERLPRDLAAGLLSIAVHVVLTTPDAVHALEFVHVGAAEPARPVSPACGRGVRPLLAEDGECTLAG